MLKVLTSSGLHGRLPDTIRGSNRINPNLYRRAFFCSDSTDGAELVVEVKKVDVQGEEAESKSSSAMVLALPLRHRPLFPGFYMPIYVKDPKLLAALVESKKRQVPYAGAFLVKDEPRTESSSSETEKNINDLKGKDLLNRLHEVRTLAEITSIAGDQVVLVGHRRLRITEMVSEDPLTVQVYHLKHMGEFNYPRLADFGAAISGANKLQCQKVLEELDVYKCLKLTLELVKKEMEISKIQV